MKSSTSLLSLLIVGYPMLGFANGGPVAWTGGTAGGGIAPQQQTEISLMSEDLQITADSDMNHYQVNAKYVLSNPGAAQKVKYGVPVVWVDEEGMGEEKPRNKKKEGEKAAKTV